MAGRGYRSVEITINNRSAGQISVAGTSLAGTSTQWIDGEKPSIGDTIEIGSSATYGVMTNRNLSTGLDVLFEGIGTVGLQTYVDTRNQPRCGDDNTDDGINVSGKDRPSNDDRQHPQYTITITGNATRRSIGFSAEEMEKASKG